MSKDARALDFLFLRGRHANLEAKTIHPVSQMRGQGLRAGQQGQPRTQSFPECICRSGSTEPKTEGIRGSRGKARVTLLRGSPIVSGHTVGPQVAPLVPAAPAGRTWLACPRPPCSSSLSPGLLSRPRGLLFTQTVNTYRAALNTPWFPDSRAFREAPAPVQGRTRVWVWPGAAEEELNSVPAPTPGL